MLHSIKIVNPKRLLIIAFTLLLLVGKANISEQLKKIEDNESNTGDYTFEVIPRYAETTKKTLFCDYESLPGLHFTIYAYCHKNITAKLIIKNIKLTTDGVLICRANNPKTTDVSDIEFKKDDYSYNSSAFTSAKFFYWPTTTEDPIKKFGVGTKIKLEATAQVVLPDGSIATTQKIITGFTLTRSYSYIPWPFLVVLSGFSH